MTNQFWQTIAEQIPAVVAFLVIAFFMIQRYISSMEKITNSWQLFIQSQNTAMVNSLNKVNERIENMHINLITQLAEHDGHVDERINCLAQGRCVEPRPNKRQT